MLGWHISVYLQKDGGASPATGESIEGTRLAVWQTGLDGLRWIDELVEAGKAISLGGDGYPLRFTSAAKYIVPRIIEQPPQARSAWVFAAGDILTDKWEGKTAINRAAAERCLPDEWLLITAWDES
jgi:hypothetical protein